MILDAFPTLNCYNLEKQIDNTWILKFNNSSKKWMYINKTNNYIYDKLPQHSSGLEGIMNNLVIT